MNEHKYLTNAIQYTNKKIKNGKNRIKKTRNNKNKMPHPINMQINRGIRRNLAKEHNLLHNRQKTKNNLENLAKKIQIEFRNHIRLARNNPFTRLEFYLRTGKTMARP